MKKTVQSFYSIWVVVQFSPLWSKWILQKETLRLNFLLNLFFFTVALRGKLNVSSCVRTEWKKHFILKMFLLTHSISFSSIKTSFHILMCFRVKKIIFSIFKIMFFHFISWRKKHVMCLAEWISFFMCRALFHKLAPEKILTCTISPMAIKWWSTG